MAARNAAASRGARVEIEQELVALLRGVSLECLVCGEFVMHAREGVVFCPECGTQVGDELALAAGPAVAGAG